MRHGVFEAIVGTRAGRSWLIALGVALGLGACAGPVVEPHAPGAGPPVRVGLLVDAATVELYAPGGLEVVDPETGDLLREVGAGARLTVQSDSLDAGGPNLMLAGDGAPERLSSRRITVVPGGDGIIYVAGKPYRGTATVFSMRPGRLTVVNRLDMETYLLGVVPREIGNVGPDLLEAAKAQAVAARTYAVRYLGRRDSLGFDVFATVRDQVYGGVEAEHTPVSEAVRATAGEILTFDGEPVQAFYSSTCAGHTASIHKVWPVERPRHYLTSVSDIDPDTGEAFCRSSNRFNWTQRWSYDEFTEILSQTLADSLPAGESSIGRLRGLHVLERTPEGRVETLSVATATDSFLVGGDRIRWIFRKPDGGILNSAKFDAFILRDQSDHPVEVVATGGGWGHGIGMCQVGAMGRARAGQDYRTILSQYYLGTAIKQLY